MHSSMYLINIEHLIKFNKDILNIYECHKKKKFFPGEPFEDLQMLEKRALEGFPVNGIFRAIQ